MPIATRDGAGQGRTPAREAILDAARSLFAAHGLHGTTVRAIARRSGLSNTLLYYYFPKKDDLLDALLTPPAPPPAPSFDRWTRQACEEALDYLVSVFYQWVDGDEFLRMVIIENYSGNQRVLSMAMRELELYREAVAPMLEVGCADAGEAMQRAHSLGYSLTGLLWQAVMHHGNQFRERLYAPEARTNVREMLRCILPMPQHLAGAA
jgi:AcrR family transcriptional regulator